MKVSKHSNYILLTVLINSILVISSHAQYLPYDDSLDYFKTSTPEQQGMDSHYLVRMFEYIDGTNEDFHSILIIRNGYIVLEAYYYPYGPQIKHMLASGTKSFTSALVGIAIDKGYISSVDQKVLEFFSKYSFANNYSLKKSMRLKHLLSMTSGLDWTASWADDDPESLMFQVDNPVQFILDRPMANEPGTVWNYSGGNSHLLSAIIQKTTGKTAYEFGMEHLFKPLRFSNLWWDEHRRSGMNQGCAGLYLRPRDMAKLGYLFLNRGKWDGKTILSSDWIDESFKKHSDKDYGYQWWIVPELNLFKAWGYGGQHIAVLPYQNIVVVFTGGIQDSPEYPLHIKLYRDFIIPSVKSSKALQKNPEAHKQLKEWVNKIAKEPAQEPLQKLPLIGQKISGRLFELKTNRFAFRSFSLGFGEEKDVATIDCNLLHFINGKFLVGLDGIYRIKTIHPFRTSLAFRGCWLNDDTFTIDFLNIDFGYRYNFKFHFYDKEVEIDATAIIENMEEKIQGKQK